MKGASFKGCKQKISKSPASRKNALLTALSLVGILGVTLLIAYYIIFLSEGFLHADYTDTILWAQATFDSGELIYDGFKYAAQLPFGGNLLMLIFMPFFGYSMTTHKLGMLSFLILFVLAIIWFCRSLKYSYKKSFLLVLLLTLILSSSDKQREIMWGHIIYYSLGVLFFLFGCGLVLRLLDKYENSPSSKGKIACVFKSGKCILLFAILSLFSLCTATNGLQSLLTFSLPLMFALFLERLLDGEKQSFWEKTFFSFIVLSSILLFSVFGLFLRELICRGVPCPYASAYSGYSGMEDWLDNLLLFPHHYLSLLGVSVSKFESLASLNSLFTMIRIFSGIVLLALPLYLAFNYKKIEKRSVRIITLSHFSLCFMLMYAYIFGMLSTASWRIIPLIASSVITSFVAICEFFEKKNVVLLRVCALCLALLLLFCALTGIEILKMDRDFEDTSVLHMLVNELESRNLTEGYATFWLSQSITLLSDNKVKARNITVNEDATIEREPYQSQYAWYESEGLDESCFLLLSDYEWYTLTPYLQGLGSDYVEDIDLHGYHILVYERNILK